MILALLAGCLAGGGLTLVLRGLTPARRARSIAAVIAEIDAAARFQPKMTFRSTALTGGGRRLEALEWLVGDQLAREVMARGWLFSALQVDLRLLGIEPTRYSISKVAFALGAFCALPLADIALAAVGIAPVWAVAAWTGLVGAACGFYLPDLRVRRLASVRRRDFRTAISVYLDLVAMRVASGAGVAEALTTAASIGEGAAFARLRAALHSGRTDGLSPARSLGRLGGDLGIPELDELAAHLDLVDTSGAQAEASLRAKADSLRDRQISDAHGKANERSQNMLIAQVLLGLGFLIFIGYPALAKVIAF